MDRLDLPRRVATKFGFALVLACVIAVSANAYTVVMRGGRRVEIPSRFVVTPSTLTYEVSPGVQVTLAVAAIDIPATEKANNEEPGSLLRRAQSNLPPPPEENGRTTPTPARRTITNRDLESSMRRRRESEMAYENRRKELGLPSVEESREKAAAESDLIRTELAQRHIAEGESESYWRDRAAALRTEMATADAELAYVRARLDDGPWPNGWTGGWSGVSFNTVTHGVLFGNSGRGPFGNSGRRAGFGIGPQHRPSVFVAPSRGAQLTGRVTIGGGATRGQVFPNPGISRYAGPGGVNGRLRTLPNAVVFDSSLPFNDYSYERSALITHFNELAAARAGLNARWRELEEEARRAGAPPGWLRP